MKPIFFAIIFSLLFSVTFLPSSTLAAPVVAKRGDEYREAAAYIGKNSIERPAHPVIQLLLVLFILLLIVHVKKENLLLNLLTDRGCNDYTRICSDPHLIKP
ncbi:hypothetical protein HN51_067995 [Arachis hypogaea]|nr:uncharacterized protein DS421_14g481790 [Arachis hypogaea]